jgi:hypothetical protein
MDALLRIQAWYSSQCNGNWEHSYGVSIDTLDNPGWSLTVDLFETNLIDRPFDEFRRGEVGSDTDWVVCRVQDGRFGGTCGKENLQELLTLFPRFCGCLMANRSLEWTSASWPRYAACIFSAPRGQLAPAPQLQR